MLKFSIRMGYSSALDGALPLSRYLSSVEFKIRTDQVNYFVLVVGARRKSYSTKL